MDIISSVTNNEKYIHQMLQKMTTKHLTKCFWVFPTKTRFLYAKKSNDITDLYISYICGIVTVCEHK